MLDLILGVANEDERIRAVLMVGSRANPEAPKDIYQDYDITYYVDDVTPFFNNPSWIDAAFGKPAVMQMPENMVHPLLPPDGDGHFTYLMLFDDGNRIDLSIVSQPYVDTGEPAILLLDKDGRFPAISPRADYWHIQPPTEREYRDCCNEFWWCLNNVAKGMARDELPYAMEMFQRYARDMLNEMVRWDIGIHTDFSVSAGKAGKYFKRHLSAERYALYEKTYSDSAYNHVWAAVFTACSLFHDLAAEVGGHFGFAYDRNEEQQMMRYLNQVRQSMQAISPLNMNTGCESR